MKRKGMPHPIGIFAAKNLQFEKLPLTVIDRTSASNLVDLSKEYDLALLQMPFIQIPFESSLLGAYCAETGVQLEPKVLVSERIPFAPGFGFVFGPNNSRWDHRIVLVQKGLMSNLVFWLCTVMFHDTRPSIKEIVYRIRRQDVVVSDVFEFEKHTQEFKAPTITVPALCVESSTMWYHFQHKTKIGLTYPCVVGIEPVKDFEMENFIARLREGESDLYGAKDVSVAPQVAASEERSLPNLPDGGDDNA